MYCLFEEAGKLLTGHIMAESPASLQVELESGKRSKIKAAQRWFNFDKPEAQVLLKQAQVASSDIDLDLIWSCAPEQAFTLETIANEYFGSGYTTVQLTALLLRLKAAPHYFRRQGVGQFQKAHKEVLEQALAAIAKKEAELNQIEDWAEQLAKGECPPEIREQAYALICEPAKNSAPYKALCRATELSRKSALELLEQSGAIESPYALQWHRFLLANFPQGIGFPTITLPTLNQLDDLPTANVKAFSIDDASTTEIDDALSVSGLGTGSVIIGIHIAAPSLAIRRDDALDKLARARQSTVYMPGYKIPMLPDALIETFSLTAGEHKPTLSLYLKFNESNLALLSTESRIERVFIADNLRLQTLKLTRNEDRTLNSHDHPFSAELSFLYQLAEHHYAQRQSARGRPEQRTRPDYQFTLEKVDDNAPPQGNEVVHISPRTRDDPIDRIVSECMILANTTWGSLLKSRSVPGIYRSQASLAPGIKVRMGIHPEVHAGMGVPVYAWCTSPLRRYVDLVNQWQLIACIQNETAALLSAPFGPKDLELFAIINQFESAHSSYQSFQNDMERYWALRYVAQNTLSSLTATIINEKLARVNDLPLVLNLPATGTWTPGSEHTWAINQINWHSLEIFVEPLGS